MKFKEWLKANEEITSTSCVAGVPKMLGGGQMVRRWWISDWENELNSKSKNKRKFTYRVPQIQD